MLLFIISKQYISRTCNSVYKKTFTKFWLTPIYICLNLFPLNVGCWMGRYSHYWKQNYIIPALTQKCFSLIYQLFGSIVLLYSDTLVCWSNTLVRWSKTLVRWSKTLVRWSNTLVRWSNVCLSVVHLWPEWLIQFIWMYQYCHRMGMCNNNM